MLEIVTARLVCEDEVDRLISFSTHQRSIDCLAEFHKAMQARIAAGYCPDLLDAVQQLLNRQNIEHGVQLWLQNLFQVGIVRGLHLVTVQRCLIFMDAHILAIMNAKSIAKEDHASECLVTSKGATIYQNSPEAVILCFWRDVLLTAIAHNDNTVLSHFKAHAATDAGLGLTDALSEKMRPAHNILHLQPEKLQLFDSWHTADMKAAIPQLNAFLQE